MNRATADRSALVEEHLGLAHSCAKRYAGRGIDYDDLFQTDCLGLLKAVDGFDPTRGVKFSTYAVPVILGEIRRLFRDGGTVKVSRGLKELGIRAARVQSSFHEEHGREPKLSELASALGLPPEDVAEAICAVQRPLSLTVDGEDGDIQHDLPCAPFDEGLIDLIALRQTLCALDPADRALVGLRFRRECTQSATARALGMTQVQVSRREKKIISTLRDNFFQ